MPDYFVGFNISRDVIKLNEIIQNAPCAFVDAHEEPCQLLKEGHGDGGERAWEKHEYLFPQWIDDILKKDVK